jgi:hypothetical protein
MSYVRTRELSDYVPLGGGVIHETDGVFTGDAKNEI